MWRSFRRRNFRLFWTASFLSIAAFQLGAFIRVVLGYDLSGDAVLASIVAMTAAPGFLIATLYGGYLGDRLEKRELLRLTQSVNALLMLIVALLLLLDMLPISALIFISVGQGFMLAVQAPIRQAMLPNIVSEDELRSALSLNSFSIGAVNLFSAAAGGIIYDFVGPWAAFFTISMMALVDVLLLSFIPKQGISNGSPALPHGVLYGIILGLRYVWKNRQLRLIMLHALTTLLLFMPVRLLVPVLAEDGYGVSTVQAGWIVSAIGAGGIVGALTFARADLDSRMLPMLVGVDVIIGTALIFMSVFPVYYAVVALAAYWGFGIAVFIPLQQALILKYAEPDYHSRALSVFFIGNGIVRLGLFPLGLSFEYVGSLQTLLILGIAIIAIGAVMAVFTVVRKTTKRRTAL